MSHEVWEEYYDRLAALIAEHRTTLVFVNTRRMAERVARHLSERLGEDAVDSHHGSLAKETRLDAEQRLKRGELKAIVATASLELGIDIGHVDLVCQIGSPHRIATFLQRVGRAGHTIAGTPKGRLLPAVARRAVECAALLRAVRRGELDRDRRSRRAARRAGAADRGRDRRATSGARTICSRWCGGPGRIASCARATSTRSSAMLAERLRDAPRAGARRSSTATKCSGRLRGAPRRAADGAHLGRRDPRRRRLSRVLEPDETFVGTLNEDFAIESKAGDVFQLGQQLVADPAGRLGRGPRRRRARGAADACRSGSARRRRAAPSCRAAVSDLARASIDARASGPTPGTPRPPSSGWLADDAGVCAARRPSRSSRTSRSRCASLGTLPTQETLVLERFFDESGGMQLVLHAPFGSRVNRAWALALRKRFCRQFNFELQAAATEDGPAAVARPAALVPARRRLPLPASGAPCATC